MNNFRGYSTGLNHFFVTLSTGVTLWLKWLKDIHLHHNHHWCSNNHLVSFRIRYQSLHFKSFIDASFVPLCRYKFVHQLTQTWFYKQNTSTDNDLLLKTWAFAVYFSLICYSSNNTQKASCREQLKVHFAMCSKLKYFAFTCGSNCFYTHKLYALDKHHICTNKFQV